MRLPDKGGFEGLDYRVLVVGGSPGFHNYNASADPSAHPKYIIAALDPAIRT